MKEAISMKKEGTLKKVHGRSSHVMVLCSNGWIKIKNEDDLEKVQSQIRNK